MCVIQCETTAISREYSASINHSCPDNKTKYRNYYYYYYRKYFIETTWKHHICGTEQDRTGHSLGTLTLTASQTHLWRCLQWEFLAFVSDAGPEAVLQRNAQHLFIKRLFYLLRWWCHLYLLASGADQMRLSVNRSTTTTRAATRQSTSPVTWQQLLQRQLQAHISHSQRDVLVDTLSAETGRGGLKESWIHDSRRPLSDMHRFPEICCSWTCRRRAGVLT